MKKLILLLIVLPACVGLSVAQTTVSYIDLSTNATYDSGIKIHATLSPKGAITLDTGSVSALMTNGGTFSSSPSSGNGAYFNYNCGAMGSGSIWNVAGFLVVLSTSKQGVATAVNYQLTMTFSGYDYSGRVVSGHTIQMFTVSQTKSGVTQVKVIGGTTDLTVN